MGWAFLGLPGLKPSAFFILTLKQKILHILEWLVPRGVVRANFYWQHNPQTSLLPKIPLFVFFFKIPLFDGVVRSHLSGESVLALTLHSCPIRASASLEWRDKTSVCPRKSPSSHAQVHEENVRFGDMVTSELLINSVGSCLDFSGTGTIPWTTTYGCHWI